MVFNQIVSRLIPNEEVYFLESNLPIINHDFNQLDVSKCPVLKEKFNKFQILKNTNVTIPVPENEGPYVFHSTFLRAAKNKNVRTVVTIHDFTHQFYFKPVQRFINNCQKKNAYKYADGIIFVSENTRKDFQKFFPKFDMSRTKVVYNAADECFRPMTKSEIQLPQELKHLEDKKVVLFIGDRVHYKRFDFCVEMMKKDPEAYLVMVGGKEINPQEEESLSPLKGRYERLTGIPSETLVLLYNRAYCMIYPSAYEGFGIPVLEAMKCGCPVIAANRSSIPEVARGSFPLLEDYDIEKAMELYQSFADPKTRKRLAEAEIEASKFFSWDKAAQETKDFYQYILEKGPRK